MEKCQQQKDTHKEHKHEFIIISAKRSMQKKRDEWNISAVALKPTQSRRCVTWFLSLGDFVLFKQENCAHYTDCALSVALCVVCLTPNVPPPCVTSHLHYANNNPLSVAILLVKNVYGCCMWNDNYLINKMLRIHCECILFRATAAMCIAYAERKEQRRKKMTEKLLGFLPSHKMKWCDWASPCCAHLFECTNISINIFCCCCCFIIQSSIDFFCD